MKASLSRVIEWTSYAALFASVCAISLTMAMPAHSDDKSTTQLHVMLKQNQRLQDLEARIEAIDKRLHGFAERDQHQQILNGHLETYILRNQRKLDNVAAGLGSVTKRVAALEAAR